MISKYKNSKKETKLNPLFVLIAVFTVSFALFMGIRYLMITNERQAFEKVLHHRAQLLRNDIDKFLNSNINALILMSKRWEVEGGTDKTRWAKDASNHVNYLPGLTTIEWVDKSYHVRWVEPVEGNEKVVGLNIVFNEQRRQALAGASDKHIPTLTPPLDLLQGYRAFITYVPLYVNNQFDGFIVGIFDIQKLMTHFLKGKFSDDISIHLLINNQFAFDFGAEITEHDYDILVEEEFVLYDVVWKVQVHPDTDVIVRELTGLPNIVFILGIFGSVLLSLSVFYLIRSRLMTAQLILSQKKLSRAIRKEKRASLELQEQKYALDQHSIVAITDVKGTITFVNKKFCEISGYSKQELIGQNHRILNSGYHDKSFFKAMYQSLISGKVWHAEVCNRRKDGSLYWVDSTMVPFCNAKGKPISYVAIRTDVTERKAIQDELIHAKNAAEEAAIAKGQFLASMSHEIRTPMNGVIGMLNLLLMGKLDEEQSHRVEMAYLSAKSLLSLINDILDFSKIDAGKLDIEMIDFDLSRFLTDFVKLMNEQAKVKALDLLLDIDDLQHTRVVGDPGRLRQVLTNLVSNAIKFTENGRITIQAATERENNHIRFKCSVSDTGIGIPDDKLNILFESFSQVDASTTRKYGGTGLGLAICKKLCELMGGYIAARSELDKGSRFEFVIQLKESTRTSLIDNQDSFGDQPQVNNMLTSNSADEDVAKVQSTVRVLLVEDNHVNQLVATGMLNKLGVDVDIAHNGKEALEKLRQVDSGYYACVLMDCQMPEMDGYEASREIRASSAGEQHENITIIAMTANAMKGDREKCIQAGMNDYMTKPVDPEKLHKVLSDWIEHIAT